MGPAGAAAGGRGLEEGDGPGLAGHGIPTGERGPPLKSPQAQALEVLGSLPSVTMFNFSFCPNFENESLQW